MATLTITTTAQQDARIAEAFGEALDLGRNANAAEVRAALIEHIRITTLSYERQKALRAIASSTLDIT